MDEIGLGFLIASIVIVGCICCCCCRKRLENIKVCSSQQDINPV